jgi:hypothetical protein
VPDKQGCTVAIPIPVLIAVHQATHKSKHTFAHVLQSYSTEMQKLSKFVKTGISRNLLFIMVSWKIQISRNWCLS